MGTFGERFWVSVLFFNSYGISASSSISVSFRDEIFFLVFQSFGIF